MTDFKVQWSRQALRDLRALDATVQMRVLLRVEQAKGDPLPFFQRLSGERALKMRVGDWRVIADVRLSDRLIVVLSVGHRRAVYRR